ncbi:uncharacterized protein [Diadema antillarum]|uniref:uncharacterized protein n=1 Tax=Diadema antillarum TaxID=105358 RepID=UPI003A8713B8
MVSDDEPPGRPAEPAIMAGKDMLILRKETFSTRLINNYKCYDIINLQDRSGSVVIDCIVHLSGLPRDVESNLASHDTPTVEATIMEEMESHLEAALAAKVRMVFRIKSVKVLEAVTTIPTATRKTSVTDLSQSTTTPTDDESLSTETDPIEVFPECFTCGTGQRCLPRSWVCDGDLDCENGEDERNCRCDSGFQCSSGVCINSNYQCDGVHDCESGEDEENCTCDSTTNFRCFHSGACIPKTRLCNFYPDCDFHEDESEEECNVLSLSNSINLTVGMTYEVKFPAPLLKGAYTGEGSFAVWLFDSTGDSADLLVSVAASFPAATSPDSYLKFGRGLNATRTPIAAFQRDVSTSPIDLNPFYVRSASLWAVLYLHDGDVIHGSFNVTAAEVAACSEGEEVCHYSPECIPIGGRCDGNRDCTFTGEDESLCLTPLGPGDLTNSTDYSSSSFESSYSYYYS